MIVNSGVVDVYILADKTKKI